MRTLVTVFVLLVIVVIGRGINAAVDPNERS